jgi:hypothetical protein
MRAHMSNTTEPLPTAPKPPREEGHDALDEQCPANDQLPVDLDRIQGSASLLTAVRAYDRAYQERQRQTEDEDTDG